MIYEIVEWCPYCQTEAEMKFDSKSKELPKCPTCGSTLRPCSLCDLDFADCKNCKFEKSGNENKTCRTCANRERWECGSKVIQYCSVLKSNRTFNGKKKIKVTNPACDYYTEETKGGLK